MYGSLGISLVAQHEVPCAMVLSSISFLVAAWKSVKPPIRQGLAACPIPGTTGIAKHTSFSAVLNKNRVESPLILNTCDKQNVAS